MPPFASPLVSSFTTLPAQAGIGLRHPHHRAVRESPPAVAWWEVHSENFFAASGVASKFLQVVAENYPLSLHGVGASLGGVDTLFERHLERLARLVERVEPAAISEHLCWSSLGELHLNDLLPLPYTHAALALVGERIDRLQSRLKRRILIENVSSYLQWQGAQFTEWDFLAEAAKRSGCGILLDINNIYVSAQNHGFDAAQYLAAIPRGLVGEFHLAGYETCTDGDENFLVDTHGACVQPPVWALYEAALQRFGALPTLIEWDTAIPPLAVLLDQAAAAERRLDACREERNVAIAA